MHGWTVGDHFPAYLYCALRALRALRALADEAGVRRPGLELFRFLALPAAPEERAAA